VNSKGFTLVEILVAMTLMVMVVFAFTPFMLSSLGNVRVAGEQRHNMYVEKGDIEQKLADGIDYTASGEEDDSLIVPFRRGSTEALSSVRGVVLQSVSGLMTTFLAKDVASLSITPSRISESSPNDTVIQIFCDFAEFTDPGLFRLEESSGSVQYANGTLSPVQFLISDVDPYQATLTILDTSILSLDKAPYWVCYGDIKARLDLAPPSLVAVGQNGAYYVKKGGQWQRGIVPAGIGATGQLGTVTLRDAVWTGDAYAAGGDSGTWYHTGGGSWILDQLDSHYHFLDLHYSTLTQKLHTAGYYHDEAWLWIIKLWDLDYRYYQELDDPADVAASYSGGEGYAADAVTTGYVDNNPVTLRSYRNVDNNNSRVTVGGSDLAVVNGSRVTAMAANDRGDNGSEFVVTVANGKIFNYAYQSGGYTLANNGDAPDPGRQLRTDKPPMSRYVYSLTNPVETVYSDTLLPVSRSGSYYNVLYEGEQRRLRNRTGSCHYVTETYYEHSTVTVSGDLRGVAFGNDIWVAAGGTTHINATNTYSKDVVSLPYNASNSSSPVWQTGTATTTVNATDDPNISGRDSSTILCRSAGITEAGRWEAADLSDVAGYSGQTLNAVEFIGGRFYAVGDAGVILSSEDGREWTLEPKISGQTLTAHLYGIAGWGE
jgi:prepilin-type N-terminal cleavage/methylation domain-containing protein